MVSFNRNLLVLILFYVFLSIFLPVYIYAQTEFAVPTVQEENMEAENQKQTDENAEKPSVEESKTEETEAEKLIKEEKAEEEKAEEEKAEEEKAEEEKAPQESCATQEEFYKLIAENDGGTVVLTGDIYWNECAQDWLRVVNETTVVMNGYSIFIEDNASMMLIGPFHFTGEGQNTPLIILGEQSVFTGESGVTIFATGMASTAVHMTGTSSLTAESITAEGENCVTVLVEGRFGEALPIAIKGDIIASGAGAAAIQTTGDLQLLSMSLQASGENSAVVRTDGNVYAFFSEMIGENMIVDTYGEVVFDVCQVMPKQNDAVFIRRKATAEPVHISVFSGENYQLPEYVLFRFEAEETEYNGCFASEVNSVYRNSLRVQWDTSQIDSLLPGVYTAVATPLEYTDFDSLYYEPIEGSVEIIEELPEIERIFYMFQDLVLKMNTQISEGVPFEVRYKTSNENEWKSYGKTKLDESQSTITLLDFGKAMGTEEQEITFSIRFLYPTEYRETAEFKFTGRPPKNDGGGDRDGGDQDDQGDRENSGGGASVKPKEEKEKREAPQNEEMGDETSKIHLSDIFQPLERVFHQMNQVWKEAALRKKFGTTLEETEEKEAKENEAIPLKPETVQEDRDKEPGDSEERINDGNEKTGGEGDSTQKQEKAVPVNLNIYSEEKNTDTSESPAPLQGTVLTGAEIFHLIQSNPRFITFVENNIRLLIPTEAVEQLALSEYETFQVELSQTESSFSIRIYTNGKGKTDWSEYPLQVCIKGSFTAKDWEKIYCYANEENHIQSDGMENDAIVFHIAETGDYKIAVSEEKKVSITDENKENTADENKEQQQNMQSKETEKANQPLAIFAIFIFAVLGAIYWLYYRIKR